MSNKDFDKHFNDLFEQDVPDTDQNAKKTAIELAKAEFSQGFDTSARPISEGKTKSGLAQLLTTLRDVIMNPNNNRLAYQAFGTAAVAFLAFSIFLYLPKDPSNDGPIVFTEVAPIEQQPNESTSDDFALEELIVTAQKASPDLDQPAEVGSRPAHPEPLAESEESKLTSNLATGRSQEKTGVGQNAKREVSAKEAGAALYADAPVVASRAAAPATVDLIAPQSRQDDREEYAEYQSNPVVQVAEQSVSTFSIDVDTASYSLIRNQLNSGYLPKPQAVRAEELINYFDYDYPLPRSKNIPFEPTITVQNSPWNEGRKLVHIGIKGYDIQPTEQPDSNIVFLLDVSGSMNQLNKLPLVKQSMALLLESLKPTDLVSIVVYAGAAGVVLEPTQVKDEAKILTAMQQLSAGGSTAGGAGIRLAYQLAEQNLKPDGVNRIVLATDGDFNVGQSANEDLQTLVERKRDNGVFLSVLGFGRNNYQDDMMQTLAQNGNGVAAYIDTLSEAKKVLIDEATSTLFPIAKDVKIQVEFNPASVSEYRLIGYETRALKRKDFNNDKVDAGDIGAGHTVTAIYEITPVSSEQKAVDDLRYQQQDRAATEPANEYGFLKIRYKLPTETKSRLIEKPINIKTDEQNNEVGFSVAVASFAQLLTGSEHTGDVTYDSVIKQAQRFRGKDEFGYRAEFIQLVRMAKIARP